MRSARDGLLALRDVLLAQGGAVADAVVDAAAVDGPQLDRPGPAQTAASGPRAAGREAEYELLLEMILEGSRLHYAEGIVVRPGDGDLALLLGDQLYALGLARLAGLGDLPAVAELADVISLLAQAHADGRAELAAAVWEAGAVAVGWGSSDEHAAAKALARAGAPSAAGALRAVALAPSRSASS